MKKILSISVIFCILLSIQLIRDIKSQETDMPHGDIKINCDQCHNPDSWKVDLNRVTFKHETTHFPLLGGHQSVPCRTCHESLVFFNIGSSCIDCHPDVHQSELGLRCDVCHTTVNWENRRELWDRHNATLFPLVGVHAIVDCEACHFSPEKADIARLPVECQGCHRNNFIETANPDHQKAAFSVQCDECHPVNALGWNTVTYQHTEKFRLEGGHQAAGCIDCHINTYRGTSTQCFACHSGDYQEAANPDHVKFGFLTECQLCHSIFQWTGTTFDHTQASGFALTGAHTVLPCLECHVNNQITGLPRECYGCHQADYQSVTDPNHVTNNFDHNCQICHTDITWTPATFDHSRTAFPLTGAHILVDCIECHSEGYTSIPTDCFSCHENDFNGVTDPSHIVNNFDHDCSICHTTQSWSPATFDHANTAFPLTGAHLSLACIDCHANGYTGTPTDCYSCHENDFNTVIDPNHIVNNFDHDCSICHTTHGWSPATFDHANTTFPLTGAHLALACIDCHANGYTGTPTDCYSCHADNYNSTQNPNHAAAGFPTTCETCHNTTSWQQTTWNHDIQYFPIYSGRHQGEWSVCADCHVDPTNYLRFECIFCHEHNDPVDLADKHRNVPNYQYNSIACYTCHPTGEE